MISTLFFKTHKFNTYAFDFNKNMLLLVHPQMRLIEQQINGLKDIEDAFDPIEKIYYSNKLKFLKKNGWFDTFDSERHISLILSALDVKIQMANTEQLTFEVTEKCNLNCTYCGYGKLYNNRDERNNLTLSLSKAKLIIDYLFNLWNSDLNKSKNKTIFISFYGGEPLLNFSLIDSIVAYVKGKQLKFNKIKFSMTTNGVFLDRHMDFLVKNDFDLLVSLDGTFSNNSYRVTKNGKYSFNNVIKNLDNFRNKYYSFFDTNVNFNSVLHNRNSVGSIYKFFKDSYDKIPLISELNTCGINPKKEIEFNALFKQTEQSLLASPYSKQLIDNLFVAIPYFKDLSRFIHQYTNWINKSKNDFFVNRSARICLPTGTCLPFSKKIFITVSGKIFPCEKIGHQFSLGTIENKKVMINDVQIAEYYNFLFNLIRQQCKSCYFQRSCVQCLFNMRVNDNILHCQTKMDELKFLKYLSEKTSLLERNPKYYIRIINNIILR